MKVAAEVDLEVAHAKVAEIARAVLEPMTDIASQASGMLSL